jgi:hypothetical protein
MPDRDAATIRDLIYYEYATIIAKSAFVASDGESRLKHRGDEKFYDSIPPVPEKKYLKTIYNCHSCSGTLGKGDPHKPHPFVGREGMETKNVKDVPYVPPWVWRETSIAHP